MFFGPGSGFGPFLGVLAWIWPISHKPAAGGVENGYISRKPVMEPSFKKSQNHKMRLGPVSTNSMECVAHPLLSIWSPSILRTWNLYFLFGRTVIWHVCYCISISYPLYCHYAHQNLSLVTSMVTLQVGTNPYCDYAPIRILA